MRCDILHLSHASKGRDVDSCEPILSYLELKYGLSVMRFCVRDYAQLLVKIKPKLLLIEPRGAEINVDAIRFAKSLGVGVVGIIGEGDFISTRVQNFLWGWAKPEYAQPDLLLLWSTRTKQMIEKVYPGSIRKYNIHVSGATGFDKYKIRLWMKKEDFVKKYNRCTYKKVIGIAGWGFDVYNLAEIHKKSKKMLNEILNCLVKKNQDVLFILKLHPATMNEKETEFFGLRRFSNAIILKDEENVSDLISVCDLWIGYETTTCLEAWLLNKSTFLINPAGQNFPRSIIAKGSPIFKNMEEIQAAIDEFYANGEIESFKKLNDSRKAIIKAVIEHDDGMNFVRAGEMIYDFFLRYEPIVSSDGFNYRMMYLNRIIRSKIYSIFSDVKILNGYFPLFKQFEGLYDEREREFQHKLYFDCLKRREKYDSLGTY